VIRAGQPPVSVRCGAAGRQADIDMHIHGLQGRFLCSVTILVLTTRVAPARDAGTGATAVRPSRGFIGAGLLGGASDATNRIRFPDESRERVWLVEFGIPVSKWGSLGVEVTSLGIVTGGTSGHSFELAEKQRETSLQGVVRVRPVTRGRVALDLIGGAGVVFQKRDTTFQSCYFGQACSVTRADEDRRSPAFVAGIDVPLALAAHFGVSGIFRALSLRRGELETPNASRRSSTRILAGVTARVGW
jgi:hypothetical protein